MADAGHGPTGGIWWLLADLCEVEAGAAMRAGDDEEADYLLELSERVVDELCGK